MLLAVWTIIQSNNFFSSFCYEGTRLPGHGQPVGRPWIHYAMRDVKDMGQQHGKWVTAA